MAVSFTNWYATFVMAQPQQIELQTGPDRRYQRMVWAVWLLAAAGVAAHLQTLPWLLSIAGCLVLFLLWPGKNDPMKSSCRLRLNRNGTAALGDCTGSWGAQSWRCRWYTVLRIELPQGKMHVLICASRNHFDDYRSLLVWSRFSPFGKVRQWRDLEQP